MIISIISIRDLILNDKWENIGAEHQQWHSSIQKLIKDDPMLVISTFFNLKQGRKIFPFLN